MTRHSEPGGSSALLQAPLPVRPAADVPSTANENNEQHIRNAVNEGKNSSALLADILKQSSLADNEESNLHQILSLAEQLRNYQSPVEFTIGLVGDSGVGKSSLINSLLDVEKLARTAGVGSACTTVVTEYRRKRNSDNDPYTVEIELVGDLEMEDLLRQSVVDYRRYHLLDLNDSEGPSGGEVEQLRVKAKQAWDTLIAVFEGRDGCTEVLFQNARVSTDELTRMVLEWKDRIIWPGGFDTRTTVLTADNVDDCVDQLAESLLKWMWPFIKVVRIYLDAVVLQNGIILVDLPGFRDMNSARVRITETRLYQCDEIFVVTEISRAATNQSVEDLVVRQLGKNFNSLKRSQGVTIICTKSEDLGQESEILRDVPHTRDFNPQIVEHLKRQIEDAQDDGEPYEESMARRADLFISARNEHVKRQLMRHYHSQSQIRTINAYCVSNTLYLKASNQLTRVQQSSRNRRRSSNTEDRTSAANQMLRSSGIPDLRNFILGIPSKSQVVETKHFLDTRLLTLFEKIDMWLYASVPEMAANQPVARGFVEELQTELKTMFDTSVETCHVEQTNSKTQMLHRPLTQGMNRWENVALVAISRWKRWHHSTFLAFWNREGAHGTKNQPWVDWNEEIIKPMVDDIQPTEEAFSTESKRIFETLSESIHQSLSALPIRLGEFQRVDHFIETFPRRRRNLDYEIETITTWFFDELQTIFHDLLRSHGTSYVMQRMLPMYNEIDPGDGVTKRRIKRLELQISGDRNNPNLFKAIRDLFITALSKLLEDTKAKLQDAVDKCSADIGNDLELVRGEEVPNSDESTLTGMIFDVLEVARTRRTEALREFQAGISI